MRHITFRIAICIFLALAALKVALAHLVSVEFVYLIDPWLMIVKMFIALQAMRDVGFWTAVAATIPINIGSNLLAYGALLGPDVKLAPVETLFLFVGSVIAMVVSIVLTVIYFREFLRERKARKSAHASLATMA